MRRSIVLALVLGIVGPTTATGGHTIIIAAPVDDPIVKALTEQRLIEQSLSNPTPIINSFALRGEKTRACDRMTNSTFRWCLTTP